MTAVRESRCRVSDHMVISRHDRLLAIGASVIVSGPVWGLAFGFALTRTIRRRYDRPDAYISDPEAIQVHETIVLATRIEGSKGIPGVLATNSSEVLFVPEHAAGERHLGTSRWRWEEISGTRITAVPGRWLAELLGSCTQAIELNVGNGVVRFVVPRPTEVRAHLENLRLASCHVVDSR